MTAFSRGLDYLYALRMQLPEPELIDLMLQPQHRDLACTWIGENIAALNTRLDGLLSNCHACFEPHKRPQIRLLAAPLNPCFGLDGYCLLRQRTQPTAPTLILLDLGAVEPHDWHKLLVHEYAHALCAASGHDLRFQQALLTLCLALDLSLELRPDANWSQLPLYPRRLHATPFWLGQPERIIL